MRHVSTLWVISMIMLFSSCEQGEEELETLKTGEMITVPLNISGTHVEVGREGRAATDSVPLQKFTYILIKEAETDSLYAGGLFEGFIPSVDLTLEKNVAYEIFVKVIGQSETSQGIALFEDENANLQINPGGYRPGDGSSADINDYLVMISNDMVYGESALDSINMVSWDRAIISGFASYLDGEGNLQNGEHMPEIDVYSYKGGFEVEGTEDIDVFLTRNVFGLRLEAEESIEFEYRAYLEYLSFPNEGRDYLTINPADREDRKLASFYQHGGLAWQFVVVVEKKVNNQWVKIYQSPETFSPLKERAIKITEPSDENTLNIYLVEGHLQEGEPIEVDL